MRDDATLLTGDARAFAAFYRRFEDAVLGYFLRRVGRADLAADLTAETFARALEGRSRFDPASGDATKIGSYGTVAQGKVISLPLWRKFDAKEQLRLCYYRNTNVIGGNFLKALKDRRARSLHDVGTCVGVEHEARHYGSRSCTGRSSTSFMKSADATAPFAR